MENNNVTETGVPDRYIEVDQWGSCSTDVRWHAARNASNRHRD